VTGGHQHGEESRVVVRDRRKIDPETGQVRNPDDGAVAIGDAAIGGVPTTGADGEANDVQADTQELDTLQAQLDERTGDLQRLSAEYANYRRRVERDRQAVVLAAKAQVVGELLTVLDDIERAEQHGDLSGAFKAVADRLIGALIRMGLTPFGEPGDAFDPDQHEAVQHTTSPEVSGPTVSAVYRRGYRFGERLLRPAMVAVIDHEPGLAPEPGPPEYGAPEASLTETAEAGGDPDVAVEQR
jgi:molecular chaperone GrpE